MKSHELANLLLQKPDFELNLTIDPYGFVAMPNFSLKGTPDALYAVCHIGGELPKIDASKCVYDAGTQTIRVQRSSLPHPLPDRLSLHWLNRDRVFLYKGQIADNHTMYREVTEPTGVTETLSSLTLIVLRDPHAEL